jgi:hypothetical protein
LEKKTFPQYTGKKQAEIASQKQFTGNVSDNLTGMEGL